MQKLDSQNHISYQIKWFYSISSLDNTWIWTRYYLVLHQKETNERYLMITGKIDQTIKALLRDCLKLSVEKNRSHKK